MMSKPRSFPLGLIRHSRLTIISCCKFYHHHVRTYRKMSPFYFAHACSAAARRPRDSLTRYGVCHARLDM